MRSLHFRRFLRRAPAVGLLALLLLGSCTIEQPQLPSYETEWRIPLGVVERSIEELLENQDDFTVGDDGTLSLTVEGEIDAIALGDQLDTEIDGVTFAAEIGPIDLDPSDPVDFDYPLGDLYPPAAGLGGTQVPVPPFVFVLDSPRQDLPGFRSAEVASGGLLLRVDNDLPVPVGGASPPNQIRIELRDPVGGILGSLVLPAALAPGTFTEQSIDLSGATLPDSMEVHLEGGSPGSGGSSVPIAADAGLRVQVRTTGLVVIAADAEIGAQVFDDTTAVDLPDSIHIARATLSEGRLEMQLRNDLPVPVDVEMAMDAFVDGAGGPLLVQVPIAAASTASRSVDLAPYRIDFGGGLGDELLVRTSVSTPGSGNTAVNIRATDRVEVIVEPLRLVFDEVHGVLEPIEIELASTETTLDLPEELAELELANAELTISFQSTVGQPARIDLALQGTDDDGNLVPLDVGMDLQPSFPDSPAQNFYFDRNNSDVVDFLNNLPTQIQIAGRATVGDGFTAGTVSVRDSVLARWSIAAPMRVALSAQVIDVEATAIDLDQSLRDDLRDRLLELSFDAQVQSSLPVEATVWIGLDVDPAQVHTSPEVMIGPLQIPAAGAPRGDGTRELVGAASSVVIGEEQIEVITQGGLYQGLRLELPGTGGNFVTLRATDRVEVRGFLRARVLFGEVDE